MNKINEDFFNSTADATIHKLQRRVAQLERKIEEFKEYDKKRQEYYKDALIRLGQMESFVEEEMLSDNKLKKLKAYKEEAVIHAKHRYLDRIARLTDIEIVSTYDKETSEKTILSLRTEVNKLRRDNSELIYKYEQLLKQTSQSVEGPKSDGE